MDFGLKGRLALVTGSTGGIGRAIALKLGQLGARVIVNGRNTERTAAAAEALAAEEGVTGEFIPVAGDISTAEGATAFIAAVEAVGDLEILINNMGIFETRDFAKASDEVWEKYLQANLMSVVRMSRYFLPKLLEANNNGRIINIASEAGYRPIPDMIVYSTTKSAVIGLSRGMAELTKGKRVTVNSMLVGPTMTAGVRSFLEGAAEEAKQTVEEAEKTFFQVREPTSLLQRFLKVDEVASAVAMVASVCGAGINGSAQRVEGGVIRSI